MRPKAQDLKILLVDDSTLVLKFAKRVLRALEVPIETAENGRQALETLRAGPVDLLITDIMMPELDGFALISLIRADERLKQTYILVMTALDHVEDKVRALDLGANDYTVKPLDPNEFKARVQAGVREILLKKELTQAYESLDYELRLVANLQRRLLPKQLPQDERRRSAVCYEPCSRAGGDYYDLFYDNNGYWVVAVADVSGHGASASVLMGMLRALLKVFSAQGGTAADIINRLNSALLDNIGDDPDFISAFLALVDRDNSRLNYCAAGHGDMMILGPEKGRLVRLPAGGTVLGCFEAVWEEAFIDLEPGQSLVLYTDGLIEAVSPLGEEFSRPRLEELLLSLDPAMAPDELVETIRREVRDYTQDAILTDDLTLFVVKFN
ncbi:MAG: fused response regulator/phosphatase [Pseudomonadota bacterium]